MSYWVPFLEVGAPGGGMCVIPTTMAQFNTVPVKIGVVIVIDVLTIIGQ